MIDVRPVHYSRAAWHRETWVKYSPSKQLSKIEIARYRMGCVIRSVSWKMMLEYGFPYLYGLRDRIRGLDLAG